HQVSAWLAAGEMDGLHPPPIPATGEIWKPRMDPRLVQSMNMTGFESDSRRDKILTPPPALAIIIRIPDSLAIREPCPKLLTMGESFTHMRAAGAMSSNYSTHQPCGRSPKPRG